MTGPSRAASRMFLVGFAYAAGQTLINLKTPPFLKARPGVLALAETFVPLLSGLLGARLRLSHRQTQAGALTPASFFSLLALPFLVLQALAEARSPWAGSSLHAALTGAVLLGCLLGAQALLVMAGWNAGRKILR